MSDTKIPQMPTYLQPEPIPDEPDTYEYVSEDGELSARELKTLNLHGYVYESEQNDVEFDYEDDAGNWHVGHQHIYYFTRIKL